MRKAADENTGSSAVPHGPISLSWPWTYTAFSRQLDLAQEHLLLLSDTTAKTDSQNPCQCWLTGIKNHMGSAHHIGAPESCPVEINCSRLFPARNVRLIQTWPSSQIFLNSCPVYHKGSYHSLKCKHGRLLLFNILFPHLGAKDTLKM